MFCFGVNRVIKHSVFKRFFATLLHVNEKLFLWCRSKKTIIDDLYLAVFHPYLLASESSLNLKYFTPYFYFMKESLKPW